MDAIKTLFDWSEQFEANENPWCLFLDIIGYSQDKYMTNSYTPKDLHKNLGFEEMCMLADALKVFENKGYDEVYNYCTELEV